MLAKIISQLFLERPARKRSFKELSSKLAASGQALDTRFASRDDSKKNRSSLSHIIGIERWGQQRLRVALGEPFVDDEYNGYRPAKEVGWDELKAQFSETRAATIEIVEQLDEGGVSAETTINHNDFGDLTTKAWLQYLTFHANTESKRIR